MPVGGEAVGVTFVQIGDSGQRFDGQPGVANPVGETRAGQHDHLVTPIREHTSDSGERTDVSGQRRGAQQNGRHRSSIWIELDSNQIRRRMITLA